MRKTFEELTKEYCWDVHVGTVISLEDCIELMKLIRLKTIDECADKAEADYNVLDCELTPNIECYVLKESILQLDKNSIEV